MLFEQSGLDPLKAQDWQIEEWLAGLPHSARTKRLHFDNLNACYRYALRRGVMPRVPTEDVEIERAPDKEPCIISNSELRAMRDRCYSEHQSLMWYLLTYTGMRRGELRDLEWKDVSAESICIRAGKGGKLRHVPVHPALGEILADAPHKGA